MCWETTRQTKNNLHTYIQMKHIVLNADKTEKEYADKSGALRVARKAGLTEAVRDGIFTFSDTKGVVKMVVLPEGTSFNFEVARPTNMSERLLAQLYLAFDYFNTHLAPKPLDHPMLVIVPAGRRNALGWMSADRWQMGGVKIHEINLCSEHLHRPFEDLMETLIHEMVHQSNREEGISDCNAQQRHNKKFQVRAESFGLKVEKMGRFGFAKTSLDEKAIKAVEEVKKVLDLSIFEVARSMTRGPKEKGGIKATGVILDDAMKSNLQLFLEAFPFLNTRSAVRYALTQMALLAQSKDSKTGMHIPYASFPQDIKVERKSKGTEDSK